MKHTLTDRDIAAQVHDVTLREQGATYLLSAVGLAPGWLGKPKLATYVVGGVLPARVVPLAAFSPNDVHAQIQAARGWKGPASSLSYGVGTWIHEGNVYVDVVEVWHYGPTALKAARARGEKAIWAAHLGEEVAVDPNH